MKLLTIASGNSNNVFTREQIAGISNAGVSVESIYIRGKGFMAYFKSFKLLKKRIREFKPDLIHAHYGLSGLIANFQRNIPVITTYHGSDINDPKIRVISLLAILLSRMNIFVSYSLYKKVSFIVKRKYSIIPCGVNLDLFKPNLSLKEEFDNNIVFAGSFDNQVKNFSLAQSAFKLLPPGYSLVEIKDYDRKQVRDLLLKSKLLLMTSISEGSPQIIKEAMACNCPIVSTDVGDVKEVFGKTNGYFIAEFNSKDLADKINLAIEYRINFGETNGHDRVKALNLDSQSITLRLLGVYNSLILD